MTLEAQVTNLELSKKLKELGVKQESLFYWVGCEGKNFSISYKEAYALGGGKYVDNVKESPAFNVCSAYTVAELGELLPNYKDIYKQFNTFHDDKGWLIECSFRGQVNGEFGGIKRGTTEADARAQMLIWLIENNYINFKETE